jgi:hypothetical protein
MTAYEELELRIRDLQEQLALQRKRAELAEASAARAWRVAVWQPLTVE